MPTTLKYLLSYPSGTAAPNVPLVMQTSMESVEAALVAIDAEDTAKGLIGKTITNSSSTGIVGTAVLADAVASVALKAGRNYEIRYVLNVVAPTATNSAFAINLKKSLTTDSGTTGTDIRAFTLWSAPTAASGKDFVIAAIYTPAADETVRVLASIQQVTGTGGINITTRYLSVIDQGKQV